jgi:hypothetical protein
MNNKRITLILSIAICVLLVILLMMYYRPNHRETFVSTSWNDDTELLIVSSHWKEDLEWLKKIDIPVIVCGKEGEADAPIASHPRCKMPNVGHEAGSYLKFILEYYDELPRNVAFIHGHEDAYHQLKNLTEQLTNGIWKGKDYYSLNGHFTDRPPGSDPMNKLKRVWDDLFKPILQFDCPEHIHSDCCAQFVVTREKIRSYPKSVYEKWYDFILSGYKSYDLTVYDSAVMFELVWHILFGKPVKCYEQ